MKRASVFLLFAVVVLVFMTGCTDGERRLYPPEGAISGGVVVLVFMTGCGESQKELNTELINACFYGNTSEAESLLEKGANVNARNDKGATPLYMALKKVTQI